MPRLEESYTRHPRPILWLVRGGTVLLGGAGGDTEPAFAADVGPFYLSKEPVTNRQYEAFDPDSPRSPASPGDDDPATGRSFDDARAFCAWYARVSRKPIRLPTEVEWEYACRAGTSTRFFFGDDAGDAETWLWHRDNCDGKVGRLKSKPPNGYGLLAMLGGVWEWTDSPYRPYPAAGEGEPGGPRVVRGGSFRTPLGEIGCAVRRALDPGARFDDVGFRIARDFAGSGGSSAP